MRFKYVDKYDIENQEAISNELVEVVVRFGEVFVTTILGDVIFYRCMTFKEFNMYRKAILSTSGSENMQLLIEDHIIANLVIWSSIPFADTDEWDAGLVSAIATRIYAISGPHSVDDVVDYLNVAKSSDAMVETIASMAEKSSRNAITDNSSWRDVAIHAAMTDVNNEKTFEELITDAKNEEAKRIASSKSKKVM